ncbi:hypothetical protein EKQ45_10915 [Proteus vulgaris]|uniref:hypothetical protein n=1 Tax=Proteus terrae TaxID=1574161 RepID=UPI0013746A91|nr:hypothetical protein EKQ45_10915 [Proteus vulgaris]
MSEEQRHQMDNLANIKQCLIHCLIENWLFSDDPLTQAFCLKRLTQWAYSDILEQKVTNELGNKYWRAFHSNNDYLIIF